MKIFIVLGVMLLCLSANATDLETLTATLVMAADSTTILITSSADTSDSFYTGDWPGLSLRWYFYTPAQDWTDDTLYIQYQYAENPAGDWFNAPILKDSLIPGTDDSTCVKRMKSVPRDSIGLYGRVILTHSVTPGATVAEDSAGNSYSWMVKPYCDKIER